MFKIAVSSKALLLSGASLIALCLTIPARATTLGGMTGRTAAQITATAPTTATTSGTSSTSITQAAAATTQSTRDLTAAVSAIKAQMSAQDAAHTAAQTGTSTVPNGLTAGGLVVDPRVTAGTDSNLWVNADAPTQTTSGGQTTVTIKQTDQRAIATWQSFNVGKDTTVHFDQSAGTTTSGNSWIILNRIDATGAPSQILGQIKAEGTVMLINPNGVIFGAGSQVNTHSLIASSLDINSYGGSNNVSVFDSSGNYTPVTVNGLTQHTADGSAILAPINEDNGNLAYLASGVFANGGTGNGGGTLVMSASPAAGPNAGIVVEKGAILSTADNVSGFDNGGLVALFGPQVTNAGSITTSAGEIILAAGSLLYIGDPVNNAADTHYTVRSIPNDLYTSVVYQAPSVFGGAIMLNDTSSLLLSKRGNITLFGDEVEQLGVIEATTSITRYGSITITAAGAPVTNWKYDPALKDDGAVIFGAKSITAILPEENGETVPSDAASLATVTVPSITVAAANIDMASGSLIEAPGATLTMKNSSALGYSGQSAFGYNGRLLLEDGSNIDLAGMTGVTRPVTDYLYTFKVTANDVADTPLAKSLIGQTVTIDLSKSGIRADGEAWVGSPLFASTGAGYLKGIKQSIDQLLTKGGAFSTSGFTDVLMEKGSNINVSGGWIAYTGGTMNTTRLQGSDGKVYDVGSANPLITYTGTTAAGVTIDSSTRWGVSTTYTNSLITGGTYQPDYVDGISAGSIAIIANYPVMEATLEGGIYIGSKQRQIAQSGTGGVQFSPDQLPQGASFSINYNSANAVLDSIAPDILGTDVTYTSGNSYFPVYTNSPWPTLTLSTDALSAAGFGSISIKGANQLSMAKGATLSVLDGGKITLAGVSAIDGSLIARSGTISIAGYVPTVGTRAPSTPAVVIGPDALLDVSGLWVNDAGLNADTLHGQAYVNGGSVSITTYAMSNDDTFVNQNGIFLASAVDTTQSIILSPGSVIDVSSGGYVGVTGQLKYGSDGLPLGKGGNVSLLTYVDVYGTYSGGMLGDGFLPHNPYDPTNNGYLISNDPGSGTFYVAYAPTETNLPNTASVYLGGTIYAEGFDTGGTFTLKAPTIQIGGSEKAVTSYFSGTSASQLAAQSGLSATTFSPSDTKAGEIDLPISFLTDNGFASYNLTSTYGSITLTAGTRLLLQQSNYLPTSISGTVLTGLSPLGTGSAGGAIGAGVLPWYEQPTGARVHDFADVGIAVDGLRHAVGLSLTEFPYPDGGSDPVSANGGILIDSGASIIAEAGTASSHAAISLTAGGSLIVLGDIVAPGGSISLTNNGSPYSEFTTGVWIPGYGNVLGFAASGTSQAAQDIWIGQDAVLDVSGAYVPNPLVGTYQTGTVVDAGSITLQSNGAIVALAGSQFNLKGADATVQVPVTRPGSIGTTYALQEQWSNGGTLTLAPVTYTTPTSKLTPVVDVFFGGTIHAQGGAAKASGGTLNIGTLYPNRDNPYYTNTASYGAIVIQQSGNGSAAFTGTAPLNQTQLATELPTTATNTVYITADTLNNSSLDSVSLYGATYFSGNVAVKVPDALTVSGNITLLPAGVTNPSGYTPFSNDSQGIPDIGGTVVTLNAGYINLMGGGNNSYPNLANGTLNFNAGSQIDISGTAGVYNASSVNFTSGGDIRLLGGSLVVPGNVTLTAREIYPASGSSFLIQSADNVAGTITIASNGATPYAPLSAGGTIILDAEKIVQGGVLYAPLGTIQLGVNASQPLSGSFQLPSVTTDTVILKAGSLTSVSAAGLDLPYGSTVNGIDWTYKSDTGSGATTTSVTAPPAKEVILAGSTIDTQKGAVLDESGGGDVYATEFTAGTGGSRNVLNTATQTVYALVPSDEAAVAAYDANIAANYNSGSTQVTYTTITPGSAVTLAGGNGIAAGTYVLMPAMYATMPGSYRVVVVSTNANPSSPSTVTADGSIYTTATLSNAITGAKSSQTALLEIQSKDVWSKYSEIDQTSANTYFTKQAANGGTAVPRLPSDAGQLIVAATDFLTLNMTNKFAPDTGGRGGQVDITGSNILVVSSDLKAAVIANNAYDGYLTLDADQISNLGAESVLIGGTRATTTAGTQITAVAQNLEVDTDAAHALTGPDLLLVTLAPTSADPSVTGLTVKSGSVITAKGTVASTSNAKLIFGVDPVAQYSGTTLYGYTAGVSGDGSLLRVSNGGTVSVERHFVPGVYVPPATSPAPNGPVSSTALGNLDIGSGVTISGNALTFDSSGSTVIAPDAKLTAKNFDLSANIINVGGGSGGLVLSPSMVSSFAGADTVRLRSASVFDFYGDNTIGSSATPIGTLTFDGAGIYSDGGKTTITATNVTFADSQTIANTTGANTTGAGGTLSVNASKEITFGAGAKTLAGFGQTGFTAGQDVLFTGKGSLDGKAANITLTAPAIIADGGSVQTLTTTGTLDLQKGTGTAPTVATDDIGGSLVLTAAGINDATNLIAQGGKVTLEATTGDVTLGATAAINAAGTEVALFDLTEDTPAGKVSLISDTGDVTVNTGAVVDVSAAGSGYAGSLKIDAAKGTATLNGTLKGNATYNDLGGDFTLVADKLAGNLPLSGFTDRFIVTLGHGDLTVASGQTLTAGTVQLVANSGLVDVEGTIDASGPSGGTIALYGTTGVTVGSGAKLYARYQADDKLDPAYAKGTSTLVQKGGTITLGTSGTPDGTLNTQYGYENVSTSGAIKVAAGAIFDVSGGPGGTDINNTGGSVIVRAPILVGNTINVSFAGTLVTNADAKGNPSGKGIVADSYAVWSTTDGVVDPAKHFDGVIDPAGWYDASGHLVSGTFTDASGNDVLDYDAINNPMTAKQLATYLQGGYFFAPASANGDHQTFYGFVNNDTATAVPGTLMGFVQDPFNGNEAAVRASFAGAKVQIGSNAATALPTSMLQLTPEIVLTNPSATINGGAISVLTNWNLGAGTADANGYLTLFYRDHGIAPILTLQAVQNVNLDASITDGFYQTQSDVKNFVQPPAVSDLLTEQSKYQNYNGWTLTSIDYGDSGIDPSGIVLSAPALAAALGLSGDDPTDQYYEFYDAYLSTWTWSFYTQVQQTTFAKLGDIIQTGWFPTIGTDVPASIAALVPKPVTDIKQYQNYLSAYQTYINAWSNWVGRAQDDGNGSYYAVAATALPVAPAAPPAQSLPPLAVDHSKSANNVPAPVATVTDQSPIAGMDLASEASSTTYRFVAGAVDGADPLAVNSAGVGDVTIDGHISYVTYNDYSDAAMNNSGVTLYRDVPTTIRTGTGSIAITAAGNIETLDQAAPGVIYTAGTLADNAADFDGPTIAVPATDTISRHQYDLLSTPSWAKDGGDITLTAGRDIIGIETPIDVDGSQTGGVGVSVAQFWSGWYYTMGNPSGEVTAPFDTSVNGSLDINSKTAQYAAWINYATFDQGIGALGGGNVTLIAGNNIYDTSVSLPETIQVSGGRSTTDSKVAVHDYGGGNLVVKAGGNLYSSDFYVGRGTGLIQVGGAATVDPLNPITGLRTQIATINYGGGTPSISGFDWGCYCNKPATYNDVPLQLALQDSTITIQALGDVVLGGISQPTILPHDDARSNDNSNNNNQNLVATDTGTGFDSYGVNSGVSLLSSGGNITYQGQFPDTLGDQNYSSQTARTIAANLTLEAVSGNITFDLGVNLYPTANGNIVLTAGGSIDASGGSIQPTGIRMLDGNDNGIHPADGMPSSNTLSAALHENDGNPVIVYAGEDITGIFSLIKPARIEAGRDILNTSFTGQNIQTSDITSIIAGRDILSMVTGQYAYGGDIYNPTTFTLYGPGDFLVSAGRDLGPFSQSNSNAVGGIFSVGDGSNFGNGVVSYLPSAGANITALFGVGGGIDYATAIADYIDPAKAGTGGIDYLSDIAKILGVSRDQAWVTFQGLSTARQKLLVDRAFLDFFAQVSTDYYNPDSPYYNKYGRAYDTIATLFPASLGYTNNNTGGSNGASSLVHTGDLWVALSRIETTSGGDINLIGPGGNAYVGFNASDSLTPNQQGILTLQGGSIRGYTDGSVEVYQSRIFTEQGGDIDLFSANGDLNAGKGVKSSAAFPPLLLICDSDGYCRVSPVGLVTGAGIGALLSIPGQDPAKSNAILTAPHGTVDAGAAGIRVSGNLIILAQHVDNAFNIDVGGEALGVPTPPTTNLNLATVSNAATEATSILDSLKAKEPENTIDVEVTGYGGEPEHPERCIPSPTNKCGH